MYRPVENRWHEVFVGFFSLSEESFILPIFEVLKKLHINNITVQYCGYKRQRKKGRVLFWLQIKWLGMVFTTFHQENPWGIIHSNQNKCDTYQDLISTVTNQRVAQGHTFRNQRWSIEFCYYFTRVKWKKKTKQKNHLIL